MGASERNYQPVGISVYRNTGKTASFVTKLALMVIPVGSGKIGALFA